MITLAVGGTKYMVTEDAQGRWKLDNSDLDSASADAGETIDAGPTQGPVHHQTRGERDLHLREQAEAASLTVVKKADPLTATGQAFGFHGHRSGRAGTVPDNSTAPTPAAQETTMSRSPCGGGTEVHGHRGHPVRWELDSLICSASPTR